MGIDVVTEKHHVNLRALLRHPLGDALRRNSSKDDSLSALFRGRRHLPIVSADGSLDGFKNVILADTGYPITFRKSTNGISIRDIADAVDGPIKERSLAIDGIAVVSVDKPDTGLVFMELQANMTTARDLKKILEKLTDENVSSNGGKVHKVPILNDFVVVSYNHRQINIGTWGRIGLVDGNEEVKTTRVKVSLLAAEVTQLTHLLKDEERDHTAASGAARFRFGARKGVDEPKTFVYVKDVTSQLEGIVHKSGLVNGELFFGLMHTTAGVLRYKSEELEKFLRLIVGTAPSDLREYSHNKKYDHNGQSHVLAELTGAHILIHVRNGRLQLNGDRVYVLDYDNARQGRPRKSTVSLVEKQPTSILRPNDDHHFHGP